MDQSLSLVHFSGGSPAGIAADILYVVLRPSTDSTGQPWRFYLFAALVPVVFYGLYFATLLTTVGVQWSVHMTAGSILLASIAGLLMSFLVLPPWRVKEGIEMRRSIRG